MLRRETEPSGDHEGIVNPPVQAERKSCGYCSHVQGRFCQGPVELLEWRPWKGQISTRVSVESRKIAKHPLWFTQHDNSKRNARNRTWTSLWHLTLVILNKLRWHGSSHYKYIENFTSKNWKFSDKNSDIFSYFCSKHRLCVFVRTAEAVLTSTHNLCFWAEIRKIMYTPVNPRFTI